MDNFRWKHPETAAYLYKQKQSKNFYMEYYDHRNIRTQRTTKTDDFEAAKRILERVLGVKEALLSGDYVTKDKTRITVKQACQETIEYIKTIEGLKGIKETTRHLLLIAEQLGHIDLQRLTKKDLSAIYNKQLSATKRSNYNRAFSLLFEYAIDSKYLLQAPVIPKGTVKAANPRESADGKVITGLIGHFFTAQKKSAVAQENAELLALFLMFLESTGLRYGEARKIKYKDILEPRRFQIGEESFFAYIVNIGNSKTKNRKILLPDTGTGVISCSKMLKIKFNGFPDPDSYLFGRADGTLPDFTNILKEDRNRNKELYEQNGWQDFVCYQARHTFINRKILDGKDLFHIAQHAGTSIEMIQRFYADSLQTRDYKQVYSDQDFFKL